MFKKLLVSVFLFVAVLLLVGQPSIPSLAAKPFAPTVTPRAGGDLPEDGAGSGAPQVGIMTMPTGQTSVTYQLPDITLLLGDGYDLDEFMYRSEGQLNFEMDMQGLTLPPELSMVLTLRAYDVDQNGSSSCAPEVDKVYVNDTYLGTLTGAHGQWSSVPFTIRADALTPDINLFRVEIDTLDTACWAVEIDSATIQLQQNIAMVEAWTLEDIQLRRGTTNDYIGGWGVFGAPIWKTGFDATGNLILPPNPDDPIAAGISKGQFKYQYALGFWQTPNSPSINWMPIVNYTWDIEGTSQTGSGTIVDGFFFWDDWKGEFYVTLPDEIGIYTLNVTLEILNGSTVMKTEQHSHTLYVTFGEPAGILARPFSEPRTAWLDLAIGWTGNQADEIATLDILTDSIYAHGSATLGWKYGYPKSGALELIENGAGVYGDCFTFTEVWDTLAGSLGIGTLDAPYDPLEGQWFLTETRPALDGNASINTFNEGGVGNRWAFQRHSLGSYQDSNSNTVLLYDNTFGLKSSYPVGAPYQTIQDAKEENVYCINASGIDCPSLPGRSPSGLATLRLLSGWNASGWSQHEYCLPNQNCSGATPTPSGPIMFTLEGTPGDQGHDPDQNGLFEWLKVNLPIEADVEDDYGVTAILESSSGAFIAYGELNTEIERSMPLTQIHLTAGAHTIPLYFNGRNIHTAGLNGPYTVRLSLNDAEGRSDESTFTTQAYDSQDFQGTLIENLSLDDSGLDADSIPGYEALRITASFDMAAAGLVRGQAILSGANTSLTTLNIPEVQLGAGPQTLQIDLPGETIFASGIDGPYLVSINLSDQYYPTEGQWHDTASYTHDQFQTPKAHFTGQSSQDTGVDLDSNTLYDELTVTTQITARVAGEYKINARLEDGSGEFITSTHATASLNGVLPQLVTLHFDGLAIGKRGLDGPYTVALNVLDDAGTVLDTFDYQTSP